MHYHQLEAVNKVMEWLMLHSNLGDWGHRTGISGFSVYRNEATQNDRLFALINGQYIIHLFDMI